jgi:hypothetical protein
MLRTLSEGTVTVVARAPYQSLDYINRLRAQGQPERVMAWQDGSPIEYVELRDDLTGARIRATLDGSVNGECVVGVSGRIALAVRTDQEATLAPSGRPYIADKQKLRVTRFVPEAGAKS